jgi:hypothetical protein
MTDETFTKPESTAQLGMLYRLFEELAVKIKAETSPKKTEFEVKVRAVEVCGDELSDALDPKSEQAIQLVLGDLKVGVFDSLFLIGSEPDLISPLCFFLFQGASSHTIDMSKEHPSKALYELMETALTNMKHIVSTSKAPELRVSHLVFDIVSVGFFVFLVSFYPWFAGGQVHHVGFRWPRSSRL